MFLSLPLFFYIIHIHIVSPLRARIYVDIFRLLVKSDQVGTLVSGDARSVAGSNWISINYSSIILREFNKIRMIYKINNRSLIHYYVNNTIVNREYFNVKILLGKLFVNLYFSLFFFIV